MSAALSSLLQYLLPTNPHHTWAYAITACLFACIPSATRRLGGVLLFVIIASGSISLFVGDVLRNFTPAD
jgi:hypothetical protein